MPIPDFQSLMRPVLEELADRNEHTSPEIRAKLADLLKLAPEELALTLKNGTAVFTNRVATAIVFLSGAQAIRATGPRLYAITPRGVELLETGPARLTVKFLMRYPEMGQFLKGRSQPADSTGTLTPEEELDRQHQALQDSLALELLQNVKSCTPTAFERLVVDLLLAMGYGGSLEDAGTVVGRAGDGGIDGTIKQDKLGLDVIYVQAKKWDGAVGSPEVMRFCGSLNAHHAGKGVILTTSHFSKDAVEYVKRIPQKIVLIDGRELALLMIEHNVGVAQFRTYTLKRIDRDYFDNLT